MVDEHVVPVDPPVEQPRVAAVSIKLPAFWPSDPQLWFAQVQAQFSTRGITNQKTMFDYVIASLSPEVAAEICDLILAPPDETPYDVLKQQLVKRTAASEQKRLQQLFSAEELGDRKPTQLLVRRLQQLAGDTPGADGAFLRELFLQRLPTNVRMVLASTRGDTPIDELTQLADKIIEVAVPQVASVSVQPNHEPNCTTEIESLRAEIASLKQQINILKKASRRARSPHRRATSPAPPSPQSSDGICWYHKTYGDSAHKCQPPCSYQGNDPASR